MIERSSELHAPPGRRARGWILVIGVAAFLILVETLKTVVLAPASAGPPPPVRLVLRQNAIWWGGWLLLVPAVVWFATVVRLDDRDNVLKRAPLHLLAATITASAHITLVGLVIYYGMPRPPGGGPPFSVGTLILRWHAAFLMFNYVVYGLIVGAYYALDYEERFRQSAILTSSLVAQAAKLEHRATEARLHALRMELNPHFFFNSLNSISALVRGGQRDAAIATIARLGDLLRATLDRTTAGLTTLGEELHLLRLYLDIERARFGERLEVRIDVPPELTDSLVPALALQPLVENSLRHGIAKRAGKAVVEISARRANDRLVIEVRDNGEGFPANATNLREGVGLSNTRARLEQLYGARASVQLTNTAQGEEGEGGAVVTITIPFQQTKQEEQLVVVE